MPLVLFVEVNKADRSRRFTTWGLREGPLGRISAMTSSEDEVLWVDVTARLVDVTSAEILWIKWWNGGLKTTEDRRPRSFMNDFAVQVGSEVP